MYIHNVQLYVLLVATPLSICFMPLLSALRKISIMQYFEALVLVIAKNVLLAKAVSELEYTNVTNHT